MRNAISNIEDHDGHFPKLSSHMTGGHDHIERLRSILSDAEATVARLFGDARQSWPDAIVALQTFDGGIRIRFRDEPERGIFRPVILSAWERAYGFTGSIDVTELPPSQKGSLCRPSAV